jgi:hypothetical protein
MHSPAGEHLLLLFGCYEWSCSEHLCPSFFLWEYSFIYFGSTWEWIFTFRGTARLTSSTCNWPLYIPTSNALRFLLYLFMNLSVHFYVFMYACIHLFTLNTGVWNQSSVLARQALYHLGHTSSLLCSGYFRNRVLPFAHAGLDCDPPILSFLPSLGWQVCTTSPSNWLRWSLANNLPRLASDCKLLNLSLPSS